MLNSDTDISRLVVYMNKVKDEKKNKEEIEDMQSKRARLANQDISQ